MTQIPKPILRSGLTILLSLALLIGAGWRLHARLASPELARAADVLRGLDIGTTPVAVLPASAVFELRHFEGLRALPGPPPRGQLPPELIVVPAADASSADVKRLRERYARSEPLGPAELGLLRLSEPRPERRRGGQR